MQEFNSKTSSRLAVLGSTALVLSASAFAMAPAHAQTELSGNIGVVSDYVFRGITSASEGGGPAVQGGFDLESESGVYAGWWASSLGYGSANLQTTVENDLYVGYSGSAGEISYDVGGLYYWYMDDSDASGFEPYASVGLGPVSLGMAYTAEDLSWANQGDIYWTLGSGFDLGNDYALDLSLGYFTYENSGDYIPSTSESSGFRNLDISLSKSIAELPAEMFATYIVAGEDRQGNDEEDKIVIGFSYSF